MIGGKDIEFEYVRALELIEPVRKIVFHYWPGATVVEEFDSDGRQLFFYCDKAAFDRWATDGATSDLSNTMIHLLFGPTQMTAVVDDETEPTIKAMLDDFRILFQ